MNLGSIVQNARFSIRISLHYFVILQLFFTGSCRWVRTWSLHYFVILQLFFTGSCRWVRTWKWSSFFQLPLLEFNTIGNSLSMKEGNIAVVEGLIRLRFVTSKVVHGFYPNVGYQAIFLALNAINEEIAKWKRGRSRTSWTIVK